MKTKYNPTKYHQINIPDGFTDYEDVYSEIVDRTPDGGRLVEVGAFVGKSTVMMNEIIEMSGKNLEFFVVDNFSMQANFIEKENRYTFGQTHKGMYRPTFEFYQRNLEHFGYFDKTQTITENSLDAVSKFADKSCDFVWIDAAHDYDSVLADMEAWLPKVKDGGILGGHDYSWGWSGFSELRKAVHEFAMKKGFRYTVSKNSWLIYLEKGIEETTDKISDLGTSKRGNKPLSSQSQD